MLNSVYTSKKLAERTNTMTSAHMRRALLETLAYADLFDQPLTLHELHRYLHGYPTYLASLAQRITHGLLDGLPVRSLDGYLVLEGREDIIRIRKSRQGLSNRLWPLARRYGRLIAGAPFVRMVAVTGALSVSNVSGNPDIDFLVATAPHRVWLGRLFVLLFVKFAAARDIILCPNYFLTTHRLALEDRSIFTAHELMQMVPLSGQGVYAAMRTQNGWADELLPNAHGSPLPAVCKDIRPWARPAAERILMGRLGARLDAWEMNRKITRFQTRYPASSEARFDHGIVQGHFNNYRADTLARFDRRMEAFRHLL